MKKIYFIGNFVLLIMDQCSCFYWFLLFFNYLKVYLEVLVKDDCVIINGCLLGFSLIRVLGKNIELEIKIVYEEIMFIIMINIYC